MSTESPAPEVVDVEEVTTAVVAGVVQMTELPAFFDRSFNAIAHAVAEQGRTITGPAYARYHGPLTETADLEVGFPTDSPITPTGDVRPGGLPAATVARTVHAGSYESLGASWGRLAEWVAGQDLRPGTDIWETYVTEPSPDMDPADLRTELNWVVT